MIRTAMRVAGAVLAASVFAVPACAQNGFSLGLPLVCTLGQDCFIQQYPDNDPGPGAKDYHCGGATYDGHDGTDFRIISAKASVTVVAVAAGRVKGVRDGIEEALVETPADRARVKNRECGNGLVIDHGDDWETQYCHLRRGSVVVHRGQAVVAGMALGQVGYSGDAQFPHLHLSVRRGGKEIDPFLGEAVGASCVPEDVEPAASLWGPALRDSLKYRDSVIVEAGFSAKPFLQPEGELGIIEPASATGDAMLFYVRLINLRQGDRLSIAIEGPGQFNETNEAGPFDRSKARYFVYSGRKRRGERWEPGLYQGVVVVIRAGTVIRQVKRAIQLQ